MRHTNGGLMDNQAPNNYNNGNYNGGDNYNNGNNYNNNNNNGNNNNDNNKKNHNGQMILGFIMVTLVALFLISLFSSRFSQMSSKETTYSEFLEQLDKKNIKTVVKPISHPVYKFALKCYPERVASLHAALDEALKEQGK